jgi:hypothetical protein
MKIIFAVAASGLLALGSAGVASAQTGASTPGQKMQQKGSVAGSPGASGYTPGHQMQMKGSKKGHPGASGYAPGHASSTSGVTGTVAKKPTR